MAIRLTATSSQDIRRTANLLTGRTAYTWMAWMYPLSVTAWGTVLYLGNATECADADVFYVSGGARINMRSYLSTAEELAVTGTTPLSASTWYHVALVRTATDLLVYLDGAVECTGANSYLDRTTAGINCCGVRNGSQFYFDGRFAAIKQWQAALNVTEIAAEIGKYKPQRAGDLHLWSPCFAGDPERLKDYSANGYNWTATGTLTDEADPPALNWAAEAPPKKIMVLP